MPYRNRCGNGLSAEQLGICIARPRRHHNGHGAVTPLMTFTGPIVKERIAITTRRTSRVSWQETYRFAPWRFVASHQFTVGLIYEHSEYEGHQTFLPVEIDGASNTPFCTKSTHFAQVYQKSGPLWFPLSTQSVTEARIFGTTGASIEYLDYAPKASHPPDNFAMSAKEMPKP
jgi:hypothetical protein